MASQTPAALGYRMPAEWEPHAATWLSWPRRDGISFPESFDRVLPALRAMVKALVESEQVCISAAITGRFFSHAIVIRNPPTDGFAVANLRWWTGITTLGGTNILHSISMKSSQRVSPKFSVFQFFIRA